jgi:hypothetical protein
MVSVFIAGSRAVSKLNSKVTERLDNIVRQEFTVLIGDANGADKAVQRYLASRHYPNVVVYCMEVCRNNVGRWPTRQHEAEPGSRRDRYYYGIKDLAMAKGASCGFMLWDGESKGTLANVVNLLNLHKKTLLYISPRKLFLTLDRPDDLHRALHANGIENVPAFLTSLGIVEKPAQDLPFAVLG